MLRELRKMKRRAKANYIRHLQYTGRIGSYINDKGYCCYDPAELNHFQATHRRGRPPKEIYIKEEN